MVHTNGPGTCQLFSPNRIGGLPRLLAAPLGSDVRIASNSEPDALYCFSDHGKIKGLSTCISVTLAYHTSLMANSGGRPHSADSRIHAAKPPGHSQYHLMRISTCRAGNSPQMPKEELRMLFAGPRHKDMPVQRCTRSQI